MACGVDGSAVTYLRAKADDHRMTDDNVTFDNSTKAMAALQGMGTTFGLIDHEGREPLPIQPG